MKTKPRFWPAKLGVRHLKDGEMLVKEGECAGTRAFFDQTPRKASLRSVGQSTVYTLTPEDFESMLDTRPRLAFMVMRALFRITHANLSRMNRESKELANYITKSQGRY